jgi:hypothetical protein
MRSTSVLFPSALTLLVCFPGLGQEVLSARSGVVHFFQGSVLLDDQVIDRKFGSFPSMKEGSTLRTEKGRVEILLTPGVFLRLDEKSSIRMVSTSLVDTQVEFLSGSAILDSVDAPVSNSVLVSYKDFQVRFPKQGVYRFDSATEVLQAYSGETEVKHEGKTFKVDTSHLYFFFPGVETEKIGEGAFDEFYDWARDRNDIVSAQNQAAAQSEADANDMQDAQLPPLSPYPNPGMPNNSPLGGIPSVGMGGAYPSNGSSVLFDPYVPLGAGPYFPYGAYPIFVGVRPPGYRPSYWRQHPHTTGGQWPQVPRRPHMDNPQWSHTGNPQWPRSNGVHWNRPSNSEWPRSGVSGWQHPMNSQWQHTSPYRHTGAAPTGMSRGSMNHAPISPRPVPVGPRMGPMSPGPGVARPMGGPVAARPSGH